MARKISLCAQHLYRALGVFLCFFWLNSAYSKEPVQASLHQNSTGTIDIFFSITPGWWIYTPNHDMFPITFDWSESKNLASASPLWPSPQRLKNDTLGYKNNIKVSIKLAAKDQEKPVILQGTISYLSCSSSSCVPLTQILGPVGTLESHQYLWGNHLNILTLLCFSLFGGLILNIMPCVLPVLGIKLHALIRKSQKDSKKIRKSAVMTVLGILSFFILLSAILNIFIYFGHQVGWGIQFQNPYFLGFMILVTLIFSLNLWGVFEFGTPDINLNASTTKHTFKKDFALGFFAALLATPCTAPFLGTAVAYGLTNGPIHILLIFLVLGFGFSTPYLIIILRPQWIKILPKPGSWMKTVKSILALMMTFTTLWLGTLLVSHLQPGTGRVPHETGWIPFDENTIPLLQKQGKWVFVDITADWCVTCQTNKKFVLESKEIQSLLSQPHIVKMRANWTQKNTQTLRYLKSQGRAGIPFNALYKPNNPQPIILPEILTKDSIITLLSSE